MAFVKKTWKDRIAEFPTRRRLTKEDNTSELVTVAREEGTLSQEGDAFSAENMNDLENRIDAEFTALNGNLTYSTKETICGKWIDGRNIYRVVKQVTSNINTNIVAMSLPTASRVIDIKGTIETNENRTIPIGCTWETGLSIYAYYYRSEKNIYLNNKVGSGIAYIIVEYIK